MRLSLDEDGLKIESEAGQESLVAWSEILSIHISKIEAPPDSILTYLTFDTVYGEFFEVSDQEECWQDALADVARRIGKSLGELQAAVDQASPQGGVLEIYARSS